MIYRIFKITNRIGTGMEKIEMPFVEMQEMLDVVGEKTLLAAFDNETNTIHVFNDKIIDLTSIVLKFKYHCDLPNNHQFSILYNKKSDKTPAETAEFTPRALSAKKL